MLRATFFARLIADIKQQDATYLAPRQESTIRRVKGANRQDPTQWRTGQKGEFVGGSDSGRWPANLAHDGSDEVLGAFAAFGEKGTAAPVRGSEPSHTGQNGIYGAYARVPGAFHNDGGTAARFFFSAKASRAERGEGNTHPTVKPLALMQWLCRLVTPPGGTVLDPFAGSGSTLIAAAREGFDCIGIEREAEYIEIARRRIAGDAPLFAEVA